MLGRIACNCVNTSDSIAGKLNDFFVEKLGFHRAQSITKTPLNYDDVTKRMTYTGGRGSDDEDIFSDEEGDEEWESEEELDEQQKLF